MKQLVLDISALPAPTLDNFVAGQNAELLQVLRALLGAAPQERFVYLWGAPGSGKTHLLRAFVSAAQPPARTHSYLSPEGREGQGHPLSAGEGWGEGHSCEERADTPAGPDSFGQVRMNSHLQEMRPGQRAVYWQAEQGAAWPDAEIVALDDVQRLDDAAQAALFNLYNALRDRGGILLASGDAPPARLALRPDVVTRLGWGLVYQLHGLGDGEKMQALSGHAAARGFALPREVAEYLLRHGRRDLPSLMAMLDALDRCSLEAKRPITVPLLREVMQQALWDK